MKIILNCLLITFFITCLIACKSKTKESVSVVNAGNLMQQFIDTTIKPGEDFFRYAVGTWIKNNPVPASERSWGIWSEVNEETYNRLRKISEEAANSKAAEGSSAQKIGDFWFSGMDTVTINQQGISPLKADLDFIEKLKSTEDVLSAIAYLQSIGASPLFANYIFQDEMNSNKMMVHLYQGGIALPDRDYYFDNDARTANIRLEYVKHLKEMFVLMGEDSAKARVDAAIVMKMETDLAASSRKLEDLRDPYANYHKMSMEEANKMTSSINWDAMLSKQGALNVDTLIVGQPEFFEQAEKMIRSEPIENWKTYLRWHLVNAFADKLSSDFDQQNFYFFGTVMNGVTEMRPRWKRVIDAEEDAMGFMLGELYVEKYFSPKVKARYDQMVDHVLTAYTKRIENLDWMNDSTKQKAFEKLSTVKKKVGYPNQWRDYSALEIDRSSYLMNCIRANKWLNDFYIAKLYKPVDRNEWEMTPQTWNAYYNPSNNEIVLPAAAFIVPGLADSLVDDAIMYGYAAGSTIGHEITHGFDDMGSQFDAQGNLKEWWTPRDRDQFKKLCEGIVGQFDQYVVLDSMHVNGDATQGENIADLGGMLIGMDAFKMTDQYKEGKVLGGFTPLQRYFLGFALSWYGVYRDEALAVRIKSDVHSPNFLRVNGSVVNVDDWYSAFNIQQGDKMYREDSARVKIW